MARILLKILVIFCVLAANIHKSVCRCPLILESGRLQCGKPSILEDGCSAKGCCWDDNAKHIKCYSKACRPGFFGYGCKFPCFCKEDEVCDSLTGECPSGCLPDRWGVGCLLDNECTYNDDTGAHYQGKKTTTSSGYECAQWSKQSAYPDNQFPDSGRAIAENYCRNPKPNDYRSWCYYTFRPHRDWDYCALSKCECMPGRFDINCAKECHCADQNEACDQKTGACASGCAIGWAGKGCQECGDGYFGRNCVLECRCKNVHEVCNKTTGHCSSGCRQGFNGDGCQIKVPELTRPPVMVGRNAHTLGIRWHPWSKRHDSGDGPITYYLVHYREEMETDWEERRIVAQGHKQHEDYIDNLKEGTYYVIEILPVHKKGFSGYPSPPLTVKTCGKPTAGAKDIAFRNRDSASEEASNINLLVTWKKPDKADWECQAILEYRVYMEEDGAYILLRETPAKLQEYEIKDVSIYYNLTVAVSAVNDAGIEGEKTVAIFIGKSAEVDNLIIDGAGPDTLDLSWDPPSRSNGIIVGYKIKYRLIQVSDCSVENSTWSDRIDLDADTLDYTMNKLHPYSRYQVRMWAETAAGRGKITTQIKTTMAQAPTVTVNHIIVVAVAQQSATLEWEPPGCMDRRGHYQGFLYEVRRMSTSNVFVRSRVNATGTTINGLIPYVKYGFKIKFVNHVAEGPSSHEVYFTTEQASPTVVQNVHVALAASDQVVVKWLPPDPPHGVITNYEVEYWSGYADRGPVKISGDQLSYRMTHLQANTSYGIRVRAYTKVGEGIYSEIVYAFTEESIPEAPADLWNISRTQTAIELQWLEPVNHNGVLKSFKVLCSPVSPLGKFVSSTSPDQEDVLSPGSRRYMVTGLVAGFMYVCSVKASTSKGFGPSIRKHFWTLPEEPQAPTGVVLQESQTTDTTIQVKLVPSEYISRAATLQNSVYQIVVERLVDIHAEQGAAGYSRMKRSGTETPCGLKYRQLVGYEDAQDRGHNCYIAAQLQGVRKGATFTVGDNGTYGGYSNIPLEKGQEYEIWFGVVVTVDGMAAASYTKTVVPVVVQQYVGQKSDPANLTTVAAAGVAALVAIVLLILMVAILVTRKKKKVPTATLR